MKTAKFLSLLLALLAIASCKTTSVTFDYLGPASINIGQDIQNIVVVDHSAPKDQVIDIIEGALTGEGIGQDVEAVLNLIEGIKEIGSHSHRFSISREKKRYGKGKLLENIPQPMDLSLIRKIGRTHNADAVLAIDKFDSDFIVTDAKVDYSDDENVSEETRRKKAYRARGVATVTVYIRLYETSSGDVIDELKQKESFSWSTYGETVDAAVKALLRKQVAVNKVSYRSGLAYGRRIAPSRLTVTRQLYRKPKKHTYLARGVRKAEVADWKGAIADWKVATNAQEQKVRQRASYNIAIAYEVLGNLEKAKKWAQKSHIDHGEKKAKEYYDILVRRADAEKALLEQLGE